MVVRGHTPRRSGAVGSLIHEWAIAEVLLQLLQKSFHTTSAAPNESVHLGSSLRPVLCAHPNPPAAVRIADASG